MIVDYFPDRDEPLVVGVNNEDGATESLVVQFTHEGIVVDWYSEGEPIGSLCLTYDEFLELAK